MKKIFVIACFLCACFKAFADDWTGTWHRSSLNDSADIVITAGEPGEFHFLITAFSGAHTGEIEGEAVIDGSAAFFVFQETDGEVERKVDFKRTADGIIITTENCGGYFGGAGVIFNGVYLSVVISETELAEERLAQLVKDKNLREKIRKLLGTSLVDLVYRLHLISPEETLDDFPATVISGGVLGIAPIASAILMFTPDNRIYAAWLDDGKVYYLSSDPKFKKKLPKTIAAWAEQFEGAKVIFK